MNGTCIRNSDSSSCSNRRCRERETRCCRCLHRNIPLYHFSIVLRRSIVGDSYSIYRISEIGGQGSGLSFPIRKRYSGKSGSGASNCGKNFGRSFRTGNRSAHGIGKIFSFVIYESGCRIGEIHGSCVRKEKRRRIIQGGTYLYDSCVGSRYPGLV